MIRLGFYTLIFLNYVFVEVNLASVFFTDLIFYFLFDWVSFYFCGFVLLIRGLVIYYRHRYIEGETYTQGFLYLVLLFVLSIVFIVLRPNIVIILLGWDGLGLVSYCLVIFYQNEVSRSAGIITVLTNRLGDVGMLLRLVFLLNCIRWDISIFKLNQSSFFIIVVIIILGALTKRAQIPFSAWLPAAIAAPTPVSALVHSSTLVTAGVYLIIRFRSIFSNGELREVLIIISVLTMFIAGLSANFEFDLKKIIALSTLRQLGVMIIILSLGFYEIAFFHLITHAMFKAILFLCAGVVIHCRQGSQDIRHIGCISSRAPLLAAFISLARLSLSGVLFLRGFYSKDLILEAIYLINNSYLILLILLLATTFTVRYSLRLGWFTFWRAISKSPYSSWPIPIYIFSPLVFIRLIVVGLGRSLRWVLFPHNVRINLTWVLKLINLCLIILGGLIFYIIFFVAGGRQKTSSLLIFLRNIWFLPYLTPGVFSKRQEKRTFIHLEVDLGWHEEYFSMGVFTFFNRFNYFFFAVNSPVIFLIRLVIILILIIVYFYSL